MSHSPPRERTFAIVVLTALAAIAGVLSLIDAARYMGWLAIGSINGMQFVLPQAHWLAALMAVALGAIFFMVASWLWNLNPSGWLFVVVLTIANLFFLFLAILGRTAFSDVMLQVIVNVLALALALLPDTRSRFLPAVTVKQPTDVHVGGSLPAMTADAATDTTGDGIDDNIAYNFDYAQTETETAAARDDDGGSGMLEEVTVMAASRSLQAATAAYDSSGNGMDDEVESPGRPAPDAFDSTGDGMDDDDAVKDAASDAGRKTDDAADAAGDAVQEIGVDPEIVAARSGGEGIDFQLPLATGDGADLTRIEGIGPKIARMLNLAGVYDFQQLAGLSTERLRQLLADAHIGADPDTWAEQASLAAAGKWDELDALQKRLDGGRKQS
ncbi:MAG: hypothetical protein H6642_04500 [Caldilineaceae bacterium]|nr:hypothetical protein [Caldilineaceae bacterium]